VEISLSPLETDQGKLITTAIRDATERKRREKELRASLREKEALLKEVHHRVKNNLAVVSDLLYLQSTYTNDAQALKLFQDSQDRVRSLALVHETLYRFDNFAALDFSEYARSLVESLVQSYALPDSRIRWNIKLDSVDVGVETAVPCGLILNELITNAIKHAFPNRREGEIEITLQVQNAGYATLQVNDDGVGIPSDMDVRMTKSLGLRLIRTLTRQIDGEFQFLPVGAGTRAQLTFPLTS